MNWGVPGSGHLKLEICMKDMIKQGLLGAVMGCIMSFLLNYFIISMPHPVFANAAGNGISGLISGFMGGFIGIFAYKDQCKKSNSKEDQPSD